jgi:hypothetical protein
MNERAIRKRDKNEKKEKDIFHHHQHIPKRNTLNKSKHHYGFV